MPKKNKIQKKSIYNQKKYWYHVSTTLEQKIEHLIPRGMDGSFNRSSSEPIGKRICVSPTIEQCITAIPYNLGEVITIYRTKDKVIAKQPWKVFDSHITDEGWLEEPTTFIKLGILDFQLVEQKLKKNNVIPQAAASSEPKYSGRVLKWWQTARIKRFIEKS